MYSRHGYRSSNPNLSTMINRPPRPPCWRDFLQPSDSKRGSSKRGKGVPQSLSFTDLSTAHHRSHSEGNDLSKVGSHVKSHRKNKGKLHRTCSQLSIEQEHLPQPEHMTVTLADTKPRELLRKPTWDARIYLNDNIRRCEKWLAGVRASEPLDDVVFSKGSGVVLEIPEENWVDLENLKNSHNSSTSESEFDSVSACCGSNMMEDEAKNRRRAPSRSRDTKKPKKMESQGQRSKEKGTRRSRTQSGNLTHHMEVVPEHTDVIEINTRGTDEEDVSDSHVTGRDAMDIEMSDNQSNSMYTNRTQIDIMDTTPEVEERVPSVEATDDPPAINISFLHATSMPSKHTSDHAHFGDFRLHRFVPGYVSSDSDFDWKTCHAAVNVGT